MPSPLLPNPDAIEHSHSLFKRILQKIQQSHGFLPFDAYLETVLYTPGLGYYMSGTARFGREGDFITAPEISPLFGFCIAEKLIPVLTTLSNPVILEVGAGTGKLARDILAHLEKSKISLSEYWILELSPDAKARQTKTLAPYLSKIKFLDRIPDNTFEGVILGNEVLDALPFSCYEVRGGQIFERGVGLEDHTLCFITRLSAISPPEGLDLARCPEGYLFEICHRLSPFLQALTHPLSAGALLMIDYGHQAHERYHPSRSLGTFQCHYRHHAHDNPFFYPGLQDITAHVDFTAVMDALALEGFSAIHYQTQMQFLIENQIESLIQIPPTPEQRNALRRLLLPELMGESFKVVYGLKH